MFFVYEDISNISHQVYKSMGYFIPIFNFTLPLCQGHEKKIVGTKNKDNKGSSLVGKCLSGLYVYTKACGSSYKVIHKDPRLATKFLVSVNLSFFD